MKAPVKYTVTEETRFLCVVQYGNDSQLLSKLSHAVEIAQAMEASD